MAVFTPISPQEAQALMSTLGLGRVQSLEGIASGIENTNYFCDTDQGRWVITIFERLRADQLPFYLGFMQHLAHKGLPVPRPMPDAQGHLWQTIQGKPAAVVPRLSGAPRLQPKVEDVQSLGQCLAQMHAAGSDFPMHQPNLRGLAWWQSTAPLLRPFLTPGQAVLLDEELAVQTALAAGDDYASLPKGPVHADLFRDNAMFDERGLSGVFDFYFSGVDSWLFDLCVVLNDWCIDLASGQWDVPRRDALMAAYTAQRGLSPAETRLLPLMLRAAALRFWISRLFDLHLPRTAALLQAHDPSHFERILRLRRDHPWPEATKEHTS